MLALFGNKKQEMLGFGLLFLGLGLTACHSSQFQNAPISNSGEQLFSNRPTQGQNFFALVKLKSAPIFAVGEVKKGRVSVDPAQLATVNDEQKSFLVNLAKVAPNTKVIYRYRFVLNGFALAGPTSEMKAIEGLAEVATVEKDGGFDRPRLVDTKAVSSAGDDLSAYNSAKFIGAENLRARKIPNERNELVPLDGTGTRVGIIDTGIDYTHSMLGGPGTVAAYKSIDPSKPSDLFPNKKVVGGTDLVGTAFDSASLDFSKHIPQPDSNPLDEADHGSHVAGTIGGVGDGVETYSGVAPGAELYAIKVFGAKGSTSDSVVMAGLEYAADPKGDGSTSGQLDVVNLSLGSAFGSGKILYTEAIQNLTRGGTVVVASAGNEGNVDYVTGAPAVSDAAISVAASIDNTEHNWKIPAVKFITPSQGALVVEAVEGAITKAISDVGALQGVLVPAGIADKDFSDDLKAKLKGRVALIDRGVVPFADKIRRAQEAGAIGVVVANNQPGEPIVMGGSGKFDIPSVMISQETGTVLKTEIGKGDVVIQFQTPEKILKPELIDTITDFSSKGPRSEDSMIKPEISAPGANIISAARGQGSAGIRMSGTSMAGPHIAGAMALLRQAHRDLSVAQLKALLLNHAKTINDAKGAVYPISRQGSGRVQIDKSVDSKVILSPAAISLGEVSVETRKTVSKKIHLENLSTSVLTLNVRFQVRGEGIRLVKNQILVLASQERKSVDLSFLLDASGMKELVREMDGWVIVEENGQEIARAPVLAVSRKVSNIQVSDLTVYSSSATDAAGSSASVTLSNKGKNSGDVLLFNLLAEDPRKKNVSRDPYASKACDLQSVGYRLIKKDLDGHKGLVLQIAAKLYQPLTHWNGCELSVLIDSNGDGVAEQELGAVTLANVPGLAGPTNQYTMASVLFDATQMRSLRRQKELAAAKGEDSKEDYTAAALDSIPLKTFDHSTVILVEADASKLVISDTGSLQIKIAAQRLDSSAQGDDFAAGEKWLTISLDPSSQSFSDLPEKVNLAQGEEKTIDIEKGYGTSALMVLMPQNLTVFSDVLTDQQQVLLQPKFQEPNP